ncbi:PREDICTED: nucleolar and coiled-body phosphoprotein 1-like isoform X2 [Amphimedon queenslandica]|uniref:Srp40 C-terminal domain-containing protein n=1 Tax=Amphimedon queenslandica TaxID=400682 RepID=A0AAN0JJ46_AMPQE|nr:PREDICTED: nucleolar and coiled-body phosphoprotein 1-like isoform X2 [Amphimedon queenslandica]|eukprot:XP_019856811.1 PREDICTED: nucleolar and coiled-body phosphoprotein 1-like isoform X2 [Amphimedon queenslandica]
MREKQRMAAVPSDLFPFLYKFMINNSLHKTARSFIKETKFTIPCTNDTGTTDDGLLDFYIHYKKNLSSSLKRKASEMESSTHKAKKIKVEVESSNEGREPQGGVKKKGKVRSKERKNSGESDGKENEVGAPAKEETEGEETAPKRKKSKTPLMKESIHNGGETFTVSDEEKVVSSLMNPEKTSKKKKKSKALETGEEEERQSHSTPTVPFRRVDDSITVDMKLSNNSFEAKKGSKGSWGEKANKDFKHTKGKSFRHEKTKKKRGTYKGGMIDTSVNSIKFDSD